MVKHKMPLKEGLELVRTQRPIAEPNPGFILQLKYFEKELLGKVSDVPVVLAKQKEEGSELKEVQDGIEQMAISGDQEGVKEIEEKLH